MNYLNKAHDKFQDIEPYKLSCPNYIENVWDYREFLHFTDEPLLAMCYLYVKVFQIFNKNLTIFPIQYFGSIQAAEIQIDCDDWKWAATLID